ncbi:MAG: hypothetical protein E7773_10190 [Sphingomonas sp.]|uniref:major capsid protein n=1 Tax=Sphingomonas sp. TaxID=28214 RepID=UPI0012143708|nr:major capsid protein [Sphingomonas sp.]THD35707.1 MAG: hypothetical protein E7773_10190 [Sphingomonas sp.]
MASTNLSNIIEPMVFSAYVNQASVVNNAFIQSGVLVRSNEFDIRAGQAGAVGEMPHFNPFPWAESNIMSDDPSALSTPANLTTGAQIYRKEYREKDWGQMDLTSRVSGEDIGAQIATYVAKYWQTEVQNHVLKRLVSIAADNADMVNTIGNDATGTAGAAQCASLGAILDTVQTMGDARDSLSAIVMHSQVYTNLMKLDQTSFAVPSAVQNFVTFNGKRVILDDNVTVTQGTNRKMYNTYIVGPAFAYGEASIPNATEIWRNPAAGNGGGEERLYSRKQFLVHPVGFSLNTSVTPASGQKSLSLTQYATSGTYNRVFDRKNVPIAILRSNG